MKNYHDKGSTMALAFGNFQMDFPEFFSETEKIAKSFYKIGVRKGDVVVIALPNIPQCVVAVYALSRIGAVASMVHPAVGKEDFSRIIKEQNPKAVLLSAINYKKFRKCCGKKKIVYCPYTVYAYLGLPRGKEFEPYTGDGSDPMFYLQSGGTMGVPKTVVLSSKSCNAMAYNLLFYLDDRFSEKTCMLSALPMFHTLGLGAGMHAPLCASMPIVLQPKFDAVRTTELIEKYNCTCMLAVPRMVDKLLNFTGFTSQMTKSLQDVFVGGDALSPKTQIKFKEMMEKGNLQAKLYPGYGLTESSICFLSKGNAPYGSIGKPLFSIEYMIVDENEKPVNQGEIGELYIASDQAMVGYLNDAEATDMVLTEIDGKKYVRTGDYFKEDENGFLFYEGRKKRLIKISGMNVFPTEIENTAKELPFVGECAAIEYIKDNKNHTRLLVEGQLTDEEKQKIIVHIASKLSHWSIPHDVVCLDRFYRTKIGKIDIKRLQDEYQKD
ncbi:MAG: acyl--CoA ligase [Clostridia bacterium]|nr:acyl--CoA ligase [Clostridia bacterium]